MSEKRYKIQYFTFEGRTLTFTVSNYTIEEGDFVVFTDEKTQEIKRFHSSRCEIREVQND